MTDTSFEGDFASAMSREIQDIDCLRKTQASLSPEDHRLSTSWHRPLIHALMLEILRKIFLLGSEGLKNSVHFEPTDGTPPPYRRICPTKYNHRKERKERGGWS